MGYRAFISYRRNDAALTARWLRTRLRSWRPPPNLLELLPAQFQNKFEERSAYFLDTSYQAANDDFWTSNVEPALKSADYLIVVSSPFAFEARSDGSDNWVAREIDCFLKQRGQNAQQRIIVALAAGAPENRFPGRLGSISERWDWVDLRDVSLFRWFLPGAQARRADGFLKIAARLFDVPTEFLPDLRQEEARRRDRVRYMAFGIVFSIIVLLAGALGWAIVERNEAMSQTQVARSQLLAVQARRAAGDVETQGAIERAVALALESIAMSRKVKGPAEADAVEALRIAMNRLPVQVFQHGNRVGLLAALSDGRLVSAANGFDDDDVKLWPREGAGDPKVLQHGGKVTALAAMADGRLASGGNDGQIKLWPRDVVGAPVILEHGSLIYSLMTLPDGRLASGGADGQIKLWSPNGGGEVRIFRHGGQVKALAVLDDGRLASADHEGQIKLWPRVGAGNPRVLRHGGNVESLAVLPDGRLVSSGNAELKLWPRDGVGDPVVLRGPWWNGSMVVLPDGRLASAAEYGKIRLWAPHLDGEPTVLSHGYPWGQSRPTRSQPRPAGEIDLSFARNIRDRGPIPSLVALPDGRLASGGEEGDIKIWDVSEPAILWHGSWVQTLAVLPDGRLVSGGRDGQIKIWPRDGVGEPLIIRHGSGTLQTTLAVVLSDGRLASATGDFFRKNGEIKVWSREGRGDPVILDHGSSVSSLVALPDARLASGGNDGQIKLWPRDSGGEPRVLDHGWPVRSLAVMADGRLASADGEGLIKVWPLNGEGEPVVLYHGEAVTSLVRLPGGRLASGGADGQIKLWPLDSGGKPWILRNGRPIKSLAVLADGRLASSDQDQIKLWPQDGEGEPVVLPQRQVVSLAVLPDGRLVSGNLHGEINVWIVDEEKLINALCLRPGRNLSKDEWAYYIGSSIPWQPSCRNRRSNWQSP